MAFSAALLLETLNGAWTIALTFIVVFVLFYLYEIFRGLSVRVFLFDRPLPEQFAIAILIADAGSWIVRGSVWMWRRLGADPRLLEEGGLFWCLIIGGTLGTIGILCKLRILSIARFGHWPWVTCAAIVAAYVLQRLI